jgi:dipeptidyl aminopeptidase/acylaminoacyl peptidase
MRGSDDEGVPIVQGKILFGKLQSAGVESTFIEFANTSHSPTVEQAGRGVAETILWFEKDLL